MGLCNSSAKVNDSAKSTTTAEHVTKQTALNTTPMATFVTSGETNNCASAANDNDSLSDYGPTYRLLVLGGARSGKSALISQIRAFCNVQSTEVELQHKKAFVFENIVSSMQELLKLAAASSLVFSNPANNENAKIVTEEMDDISDSFTNEQYQALKQLWGDNSLQKLYEDSRLYMINESTKYFFDSLDRIATEDYRPTAEDLITAYCPTVEAENFIFTVDNHVFQFFEFASCGVERHNWIQLYDYIDAIIVCISLSSYNLMIDDTRSRTYLIESLEFLEEICSEPKFSNTMIFVFLNKVDLLAEKLKEVPLCDYLNRYCGSCRFENAKSFFEKLVYSKNAGRNAPLKVEFTCATNSALTRLSLEKVFKTLMRIKK
uniref:Guanine nucleotide-binding protein G(O) subunit alpha n=1 Tax=Syphacia muris TaxID=451379 RepID=A0A0N5ANQ5_9BILA